jgi:hypothetical protein
LLGDRRSALLLSLGINHIGIQLLLPTTRNQSILHIPPRMSGLQAFRSQVKKKDMALMMEANSLDVISGLVSQEGSIPVV